MTEWLLRRATTDDEPAIARLFAANDEPLEWPGLPGWPYLDFLIGHGLSLVAELDGVVVGFGSSADVGPITHLTDLFVDPGHHGQGIGRALLAAVMPGDRPRTTFSSADPRALPIYTRSGMLPSWPLLYLEGTVDRLPAASGLPPAEVVPVEAMGEAYAGLMGFARPEYDAYQGGLPAATPFIVRDRGSVSAVGLARDGRVRKGRMLDRLVVAPDVDPIATLLAAIRATAPNGEPMVVCTPGPNPALPTLLEAGFRIIERDIYCESEPGLVDPVRRIPNTGFL